jgi:hypothetical protein
MVVAIPIVVPVSITLSVPVSIPISFAVAAGVLEFISHPLTLEIVGIATELKR